uniref:uncharacterized protein LOC122601188 n=1 Tax=Erigeron canadensis TaxID=72917 RepID=UPI001CB93024|nr:uncharacterized protein LOC122601188 [Erigeron canadensis]
MSWGWRKILQIRPLIRRFMWYKVGDGNSVSAWYDYWCTHSPLAEHLTARMISRAGYNWSTKVADLISNGSWTWPRSWNNKFPNASIPSIDSNARDVVFWKDRNVVDHHYSVGFVWEDIRVREPLLWCHVV